jgi:hypothetical protein
MNWSGYLDMINAKIVEYSEQEVDGFKGQLLQLPQLPTSGWQMVVFSKSSPKVG